MKQKATVQGRSMLFNILFVFFNLVGLTMVVIGSHKNFEDYFLLFNFIGYILMALSAAGIFIFQGRLMMANVSRVLVGSLFIVSGLIKANDPLGFSYKLEEYFEDGALAYRIKELFGAPGFSLEFLIDSALVLSVIICIFEIVLGVLTIIGGKVKLVSYLMVLMMLFFTFLTWHTANCDPSRSFTDRNTYSMSDSMAQIKINEAKTNKSIKIISKTETELVLEELKQPQCVTDCGCFGDAMKGSVGRSLTPSESLWKDIILLYLVLWIFIAQWIIEPNSKGQNAKFLITSLLFIAAFSWLFGWYFPIVFGILAILGALWMLRAGGYFLGNYFGSSLFVTGLCLVFTGYVLMYEPLKDYRPFAEGSHLLWKMNDAVEQVSEDTYVLKNLKTKKNETFSEAEYMKNERLWDEKKYAFVERSERIIVPGKMATITDQFNPFLAISDLTTVEKQMPIVKEMFRFAKVEGLRIRDKRTNKRFNVALGEYSEDDYSADQYEIIDTVEIQDPSFTEINLRDYIVKTDRIVVVTSRNLLKGNWNNIDRYKTIHNYCKVKGIPFVIITNASRGQMHYFRKKYNFNVPIFMNDETGIKTIARSNPSMMVIQKGVVTGKFPHRSTPSVDWLKRNLFK
jgi:uncharacterized membrane protein YphA (DoxX/SURF4 family)